MSVSSVSETCHGAATSHSGAFSDAVLADAFLFSDVYIYLSIYINTYMYMYMYIHIYMNMYVYAYACVCVRVRERERRGARVRVHVCIRVPVSRLCSVNTTACVSACACGRVCVYAWKQMDVSQCNACNCRNPILRKQEKRTRPE